jgi:hypothetical protein
MKYVYLVFSWVLGILFGLIGLASLTDSAYAGLCFIAISFLLLPPVRNLVYSKTNQEISYKARTISAFALVIIASVFIVNSSGKKAEELASKKAEEHAKKQADAVQNNINYFKEHKEEVLSNAQKLLLEKNYQAVISQTNKYISANDVELNKLISQAKLAIEQSQREEKTKSILESVKNTPNLEYKINKNLYQQLVGLNPENKSYKEKLDYYTEKLSEKEDKERKEQEKNRKEKEARIAKFGNPPTQSQWDGSYYSVENYLKKLQMTLTA